MGEDEIRLRYVGPGWVPGVPARDLTVEEVEVYGGEAFLLGIESVHTGQPIYEVIDVAPGTGAGSDGGGLQDIEEVCDGR